MAERDLPYAPENEDSDTIFYMGKHWRRCAKVKADGKRCRYIVRPGHDYCQEHVTQENSYRPDASLRQKHLGRYKFRDGLAKKFGQAMDDPELLSMRTGVAVVETRIAELIEGLEDDPSRRVWGELHDQLQKLRAARSNKDTRRMAEALTKIEGLIEQGFGTQEKWAELFKAIDLKKEIAAAEWQRLTDLRCLMTAERAFGMVQLIVAAVLKHVPEPTRRGAITNEITHIVQAMRLSTPEDISRARKQDAALMEEALTAGGEGPSLDPGAGDAAP